MSARNRDDRHPMVLVTSGLWFDQAPGAESVGGVCLLLRAGPTAWHPNDIPECPTPEQLPEGYRVDLLASFAHPVDTRTRDYQKALRLALSDLPEPGKLSSELLVWANPSLRTPNWMLRPTLADNGPRVFPMASRARRWQGTWHPRRGGKLIQAELRWDSVGGERCLETDGGWAEEMARAQASLLGVCP